jgi:hypothetical protein
MRSRNSRTGVTPVLGKNTKPSLTGASWLAEKKLKQRKTKALHRQGFFIYVNFQVMKRVFHFIVFYPQEAFIWIIGLIALAVYVPGDGHFTLCPVSRLGFHFCPGCGLGRSISFFFHGEIVQSFTTHPLGIFAVIVLSFRIYTLTTLYIRYYGQNY